MKTNSSTIDFSCTSTFFSEQVSVEGTKLVSIDQQGYVKPDRSTLLSLFDEKNKFSNFSVMFFSKRLKNFDGGQGG